MKREIIVFRADQGDLHPVFSLNQLFVNDDSEFLGKFIDIQDADDKAAATYQMNVDALASWAVPFPDNLFNERVVTEKDKEGNAKKKKVKEKITRPDDALDSEQAVRDFFADATADKDWIAEFAVRVMRNRQPQISFF